MSASVTFRSFESTDAEANLNSLFIAALRTVYPTIEGGQWTSDLEDIEGSYLKDGGDFVVGVDTNAVVAIGGLRKVDENTVEMKRVAVHPNAQKHGLGYELVQTLEERARSLGFTKIVLDTTLSQEAARRIYDKRGYALVDRKNVDHPSGEKFDTFFYEKQLSNDPDNPIIDNEVTDYGEGSYVVRDSAGDFYGVGDDGIEVLTPATDEDEARDNLEIAIS